MWLDRYNIYEIDFQTLHGDLIYTGKVIRKTPFGSLEEAVATFDGTRAMVYMKKFRDGGAVVQEVFENDTMVRNRFPIIIKKMIAAYTKDDTYGDYYADRSIKVSWCVLTELCLLLCSILILVIGLRNPRLLLFLPFLAFLIFYVRKQHAKLRLMEYKNVN